MTYGQKMEYIWNRTPVDLLALGAASHRVGCMEELPVEQVLAVRAGQQTSARCMKSIQRQVA